jgi:Ca2+-binding EF-hand superfamily protein
MFDKDQTGQIEFNEFCGLWAYINQWRGIFQNYDKDRSGQIDGRELHGALSGFGFQVNDQLIRLIVRKYDQQGMLNFLWLL